MTWNDLKITWSRLWGEFAPGVHGGAEAMVLADAADTWLRSVDDVDVWVCLKMGYTPNEIAIKKRDNDQQNHWV